jgi:LysM repeat protein
MKIKKLFTKLSAVLTPRPKRKQQLNASARGAARPAAGDYDDEEPTTNLSSAFIVVLVLHVVAVGGIYAFNSIKQSRKDHTAAAAPAEPAAAMPAALKKTAAKESASPQAAAAHQAAVAPARQATIAPSAHAAEAAASPALATAKPTLGARQYQVKTGDNLTKIAIAYSVTPAEIMEANHLKEGALLQKGLVLNIPPAKAAAKTAETHKTDSTPKQADVPPTATTPGFYTVKKGDTATSIAHNFGLTTEELLKANRITEPKKLQIGQTLKVPPRKS